ncbi:MAG: hypothetical protein WB420_09345 [Bradyrhizobium sp.]
MTRWFAPALLAVTLMFGGSAGINPAAAAPSQAAVQKSQAGHATDLSARRYHRHYHHYGYRRYYRPYYPYYARPYYYRPYPYYGAPYYAPAPLLFPFAFGFGFGW